MNYFKELHLLCEINNTKKYFNLTQGLTSSQTLSGISGTACLSADRRAAIFVVTIKLT